MRFFRKLKMSEKEKIKHLRLWSRKIQFEDSPFPTVFASPKFLNNSSSNVSFKEQNL
jgi:hypothetical protein